MTEELFGLPMGGAGLGRWFAQDGPVVLGEEGGGADGKRKGHLALLDEHFFDQRAKADDRAGIDVVRGGVVGRAFF